MGKGLITRYRDNAWVHLRDLSLDTIIYCASSKSICNSCTWVPWWFTGQLRWYLTNRVFPFGCSEVLVHIGTIIAIPDISVFWVQVTWWLGTPSQPSGWLLVWTGPRAIAAMRESCWMTRCVWHLTLATMRPWLRATSFKRWLRTGNVKGRREWGTQQLHDFKTAFDTDEWNGQNIQESRNTFFCSCPSCECKSACGQQTKFDHRYLVETTHNWSAIAKAGMEGWLPRHQVQCLVGVGSLVTKSCHRYCPLIFIENQKNMTTENLVMMFVKTLMPTQTATLSPTRPMWNHRWLSSTPLKMVPKPMSGKANVSEKIWCYLTSCLDNAIKSYVLDDAMWALESWNICPFRTATSWGPATSYSFPAESKQQPFLHDQTWASQKADMKGYPPTSKCLWGVGVIFCIQNVTEYFTNTEQQNHLHYWLLTTEIEMRDTSSDWLALLVVAAKGNSDDCWLRAISIRGVCTHTHAQHRASVVVDNQDITNHCTYVHADCRISMKALWWWLSFSLGHVIKNKTGRIQVNATNWRIAQKLCSGVLVLSAWRDRGSTIHSPSHRNSLSGIHLHRGQPLEVWHLDVLYSLRSLRV